MNYEDKIQKIIENNNMRRKLCELGMCNLVGPTGPMGPTGSGIKIHGSYNSLEELIKNHPQGEDGDCYIINGALYIWDIDKNSWETAGNIAGPKGEAATIEVRSTNTVDCNSKAKVTDTIINNNHILDFDIPMGITGPKGDKGEQGLPGPQGPKGEIGPTGPSFSSPTNYESVLFVSYAQAHYSKILAFQDTITIPDNNEIFNITDDTEINILKPGTYEITLCGQISGVDANHGAIFYLSNNQGSVIQDLSFELKAGTTTRMDCSETIITRFKEETTLYTRCGITGDNDSAKIDFANINLLIKKYNV